MLGKGSVPLRPLHHVASRNIGCGVWAAQDWQDWPPCSFGARCPVLSRDAADSVPGDRGLGPVLSQGTADTVPGDRGLGRAGLGRAGLPAYTTLFRKINFINLNEILANIYHPIKERAREVKILHTKG